MVGPWAAGALAHQLPKQFEVAESRSPSVLQRTRPLTHPVSNCGSLDPDQAREKGQLWRPAWLSSLTRQFDSTPRPSPLPCRQSAALNCARQGPREIWLHKSPIISELENVSQSELAEGAGRRRPPASGRVRAECLGPAPAPQPQCGALRGVRRSGSGQSEEKRRQQRRRRRRRRLERHPRLCPCTLLPSGRPTGDRILGKERPPTSGASSTVRRALTDPAVWCDSEARRCYGTCFCARPLPPARFWGGRSPSPPCAGDPWAGDERARWPPRGSTRGGAGAAGRRGPSRGACPARPRRSYRSWARGGRSSSSRRRRSSLGRRRPQSRRLPAPRTARGRRTRSPTTRARSWCLQAKSECLREAQEASSRLGPGLGRGLRWGGTGAEVRERERKRCRAACAFCTMWLGPAPPAPLAGPLLPFPAAGWSCQGSGGPLWCTSPHPDARAGAVAACLVPCRVLSAPAQGCSAWPPAQPLAVMPHEHHRVTFRSLATGKACAFLTPCFFGSEFPLCVPLSSISAIISWEAWSSRTFFTFLKWLLKACVEPSGAPEITFPQWD